MTTSTAMQPGIDDLQEKLSSRQLQLTHVAMRSDGQVLYQVNNILMSPEQAETVAEGVTTLEQIRLQNEDRPAVSPQGIAWIAPAASVIAMSKTLYDVTKDGWQMLKPASQLRVDVLDSERDRKRHRLLLRITNLTESGIYLESLSLAELLDPRQVLSLNQPVIHLSTLDRSAPSFDTPDRDDDPADCLPYLLPAGIPGSPTSENFSMSLPRLMHKDQPRTYGVAKVTFSKLDEPQPDHMSFTFRLR